MEQGHLYELDFCYEEGQGSSKRPVLIIVVNDERGKAVGLKVTNSGPNNKHPHRIKVKDSKQANLSDSSHVQYDTYQPFENVKLKSRGQLSKRDFT